MWSTSFPWIISALSLISSVHSISTVSIKGTKFFNAEGQQMFWKGLAYQRSPYDPFVNETQCQLDAQLMQTLGANAIRSYHVDPTQNHDACMSAFADAGIYVFLDIDTFTTQIEETDPTWTLSQFQAFQQVIDAFAGYDNIVGFFIANEAVTAPNGTDAAPFVKAAARDCKAYMLSKGGRYIPMGYAAADISSIRPMFQDYLVCGLSNSTIDFFALNIYEWCGSSSYETSGYEQRIAEFSTYPVPTFFSEDGCIAVRPRTFTDMAAIFGPEMSPVLSGTFVYEWMQEENDYGIIEYPDTTLQQGLNVSVGSPVPMQPEFGNLQAQWAAASPVSTAESTYTPSLSAEACPATTVGSWNINADIALPDTPSEEDPSPTWAGLTTGTATGNVTQSSGASGSGAASASAASGSSTGKSGSAKLVRVDNVGPWMAFLAACIALGVLV